MRGRHRHPVFARLYGTLSKSAEKAGIADHRQEALAGLRGRVIEVGAGNGLNFAHYPPEVTEVVAVEPEPYLRSKAAAAAALAHVPVRVVEGSAEDLPVEGGTFDAAVASLVLCSVSDPERSLAEIRRVLRPGGELRYYEHVRAEAADQAAFQDRVDRIWPIFVGGCHCNRDTPGAIRRAGFRVESERRFLFQPCVISKAVAPHVIGTATLPTD